MAEASRAGQGPALVHVVQVGRPWLSVASRALAPARSWWVSVHLVLGLPVGAFTFLVVIVLVGAAGGLAPTLIVSIGAIVVLLRCARWFTSFQRSRFRVVLGVSIAEVPRPQADGWFRRIVAELGSSSTWRQIGYHLLALPIGVVGFAVVSLGWGYGLAMSTVFAYAWTVPAGGLLHHVPVAGPLGLAILTLAGLGVLAATTRLAQLLARIDVAAARCLLGPSRNQLLITRLRQVTESRAEVIDAAEAERRRIERDLHDGAQQRLVSLAMNLGMAQTQLTDIPEDTRAVIASAHDDAKQALAELRDLVRGLHPAVLDELGLDAALSGIAARSPLPVHIDVEVEPRCSPRIEAAAYFVVSESLTNATKHSRATMVDIAVRRLGGWLHITVRDDGQGGAAPRPGGGLAGLARRVSSVDGHWRMDSPTGGPTVIEVELPCES